MPVVLERNGEKAAACERSHNPKMGVNFTGKVHVFWELGPRLLIVGPSIMSM